LVESPARRGNRELTLSDVSALAVGDEIRLTMRDEPQQSLARHLYQGDPGPIENLKDRTRVSFVARVLKIDSRKRRIEFDRPLSTDVRLEWEPAVCRAESSV